MAPPRPTRGACIPTHQTERADPGACMSAAVSENSAEAPIAHKFGGTSVASAERLRHVAQLLAARPEARAVVVVSALKGSTDSLIEMAQRAGARDPQWEPIWTALRQRRLAAADALRDGDRRGRV